VIQISSLERKSFDASGDVKIYDNFLKQPDFDKLEELFFTDNHFPYFFKPFKVSEGDGFIQFNHYFYDQQIILSDFFEYVLPILEGLDVRSLMRVKANLQPKEDNIRVTKLHLDMCDPLDNQKTGIFYVNTNNGKTIFEDGTEVDSVKNRMIIFPGSKQHAGTTHTDTALRCVINFNWF